jgi:hypothetical protein
MARKVTLLLLAVLALGALEACGGGSGTMVQPPSFTLSAGPANPTVGQGGNVMSTIAVIGQNGFAGSVSLAASGLPSGVTASFSPTSTNTTSVLTLTAASSTATGISTVTVTGTSGGLAPTTPLDLTIATPKVTVTLSPKGASVVAASQTQQFTPTATGNMGNSNVTWSVDSIAGGNSTVGTISANGLYSPPALAGPHTVAATSVALNSSSASVTVGVTDLPGVFTYHNDLSRDGANTQEYLLSATTVTQSTFGKLFSCPVDGAVYTQPLWVPGVSINGAIHNVIYVATQHDSVYAFDADANPCVKLWQVSLLDTLHGATAGEGPLVWSDVGFCFGDIYPEVGVTGTPVIDPASGTIYLVSASEIPGVQTGNCSLPPGQFFHRLHALDITNGNERAKSPATIAGQVPGVGDGSSGGMVAFNSQLHHNRSGLALSPDGTVYVPFAAHEDASPYHGWLFGYNGSDLSNAPSIFNTSPNGGLGGIWAGGGAPAIDATGDVYVSTGNGVFDANSTTVPFNDYGDSILRLHPFTGVTSNGVDLSVAGWFTPYDQNSISGADADVGSGAAILLPDQPTGPHLHLLAQIGKAQPITGNPAFVFLIDRDNMGQFNATDNTIQDLQAPCCGLWGTPAFWQNGLYFASAYDNLRVFTFDPIAGLFNTASASQSLTVFNFPDATPSISSRGASNGIVWAIDAGLYGYASPNAAGGVNCYSAPNPVPAACTGPAVLHAYSATNLATEYWNSAQAPSNRDQAGNAVKFVPPTIANGKVYVSARTEVDVYGVLP